MTVMQLSQRVLNKARRQVAREENRRWTSQIVPVPREQWPEGIGAWFRELPLAVWRSRDYLAVLWQEPNKAARRLSINSAHLNERCIPRDGLTWDELQRVKRECGFGDYDAVEIYPADRDVVNAANMRHLWILDEPCEFTWRRKSPEAAHAVDPVPASSV